MLGLALHFLEYSFNHMHQYVLYPQRNYRDKEESRAQTDITVLTEKSY